MDFRLSVFFVLWISNIKLSHNEQMNSSITYFPIASEGDASYIKQLYQKILGPSIGKCDFKFHLHDLSAHQCEKDDYFILNLLPSYTASGEIFQAVQCLKPNQTYYKGKIKIFETSEEMVEFIKPRGPAKDIMEHGNCALVIFYSHNSLHCVEVASQLNLMPKLFPNIQFGAIDGRTNTLISEIFKVFGVPMLIFFHQGKAMWRISDPRKNFTSVVIKETGMVPVSSNIKPGDDLEPLPTHIIEEENCLEWLAWTVIIFCSVKYFRKNRIFALFCDKVKSVWCIVIHKLKC